MVLTEREQRLRAEIEDLLAGGPDRGFEKIEDFGKSFVRERMAVVFDEIAYGDGTFAGYTAEDRTPADGLITGIGEIDGREIFFTATITPLRPARSALRVSRRRSASPGARSRHEHPSSGSSTRRALASRPASASSPIATPTATWREVLFQPVYPLRTGPTDRGALRAEHRRVGLHAGVL